MYMTPAMEQMLTEELSLGRDLVYLARQYGLPLRYVRELAVRIQAEKLATIPLDRPDIERYAIARKRVCDEWSLTPEIQKAREEYDAGHVEICTGRKGDMLILYKIPRKRPLLKRIPYFSRMEEN